MYIYMPWAPLVSTQSVFLFIGLKEYPKRNQLTLERLCWAERMPLKENALSV